MMVDTGSNLGPLTLSKKCVVLSVFWPYFGLFAAGSSMAFGTSHTIHTPEGYFYTMKMEAEVSSKRWNVPKRPQ
jgi:hypothetical protein